MLRYKFALLLVFVPCVIPRLVHLIPHIHMYDFEVYYSAAVLARHQEGAAIYGGADQGGEVKLLDWAPAVTPIAKIASQMGIEQVRLYVYPPILADALIPLSFAPLAAAKIVWSIMNVTAGILIMFFLAKTIGITSLKLSAVILLGFLFSAPAYSSLFWGQVTIPLTLCWMFGIYAYKKNWQVASAFVFALAAAIKLTPLVVVIPFLIWKEWKWIRAFVASLIFFVAVMAIVSSPNALRDYFFNVMPAMSGGLPVFSNHTFAAALQYLYASLRGAPIEDLAGSIPLSVVKAEKAFSLAALLVSVVPLYRFRKTMNGHDRIIALALIAMISPAVAPVSWIHAYVVCYPALVLLWWETFAHGISRLGLVLLTSCSIIINSILMTDIIEGLVHRNSYHVLASLMMLVTPLAALILPYWRFEQMRFRVDERNLTVAAV